MLSEKADHQAGHLYDDKNNIKYMKNQETQIYRNIKLQKYSTANIMLTV